jgi:hypothetical protein
MPILASGAKKEITVQALVREASRIKVRRTHLRRVGHKVVEVKNHRKQ